MKATDYEKQQVTVALFTTVDDNKYFFLIINDTLNFTVRVKQTDG
jgi:hypothetical protein